VLFSAVISEHFSKNHVIISVVAAKIWYLKKCAVFIGPRCICRDVSCPKFSQSNDVNVNILDLWSVISWLFSLVSLCEKPGSTKSVHANGIHLLEMHTGYRQCFVVIVTYETLFAVTAVTHRLSKGKSLKYTLWSTKIVLFLFLQ